VYAYIHVGTDGDVYVAKGSPCAIQSTLEHGRFRISLIRTFPLFLIVI